MNRLETPTASSSRPPPLPRRSRTIASAPWSRSFLISRLSRACAPSLNPNSSTTPILCPSTTFMRPRATGTSMRSRFTLTVRSASSPGVKTRSCTVVPAGPLIRLVAISLFTPAIERPSTARMKSPRSIPARLGRRVLEHAQHLQAAAVLLDVHAHALEVAAHVLVERARLLRREVVRVRIVEGLDDPLQRRVVHLLLVDRLVVVVLDRVDDLGAQRAVLLRRRCRGPDPGRSLGMAAEPEPDCERDQGAHALRGRLSTWRWRLVGPASVKLNAQEAAQCDAAPERGDARCRRPSGRRSAAGSRSCPARRGARSGRTAGR